MSLVNETIEIFTPGDIVGWKEPPGEYMTKHHGKGPFTILKTEDVPPKKCTCGAKENFPLHYPHCELEAEDFIGHPQWVIIKIGEEEHHFSGAWFKKAN